MNRWQEEQFWRFISGSFSDRLSKVNDIGCWLLLVSLEGSIKTRLAVRSSYRNDVGLCDFILL